MLKKLILIILFTISVINSSLAFDTKASHAILIDADSEEVLFSKNQDARMTPSSMSKLMTLYMVFERLKNGTLKLDDKFTVSQKAWRKQGSKMFLEPGDRVTTEQLIRGLVVVSGNDACITLAEGLMSTEELFAEAMNHKAKELGLKHSHFVNATGWPDDGHVMSAEDLATLAKRIIQDFPEYYHYLSEREFTYNKITQTNRNTLLFKPIAVDGLKTGSTEKAGMGIVASAKQQGRRLILVINGLKTELERAIEAERLLQYGFMNFEKVNLARKGDVIEELDLWMSRNQKLPVIAASDYSITVPKADITKLRISLHYNHPLNNNIKKDDKVATLTVATPNNGVKVIDLVAAIDARPLPLISKLIANGKHYLLGK